MEKVQHPNRCSTAVFGRTTVGDRLRVMGLLTCAAWRDPEIFMGRMSSYNGNRIYIDRGSSLRYTVHALWDVNNYGLEGHPADQIEADQIIYEQIGDICATRGLCNNCDRFEEGQPVVIQPKEGS